jgi:ABC-type antimicrobial peptide transport system permease subunit
VAIVNQSFAKRYLSDRNVLLQQVRSDGLKDDGRPQCAVSTHSAEWRQIIGVVADSRNDGLERPTLPAIYVPYTAFRWDSTQLFLRTINDPLTILRPLRTTIHSFDPSQRITSNGIGELEDVLEQQPIWMQQRLFSIPFTLFGGLALFLSLFGIASTVLFSAARRKSELGIRMALGARRSHILWAVSRSTLFTIGCGTFAGLLISVFLEKLLEHWVPGNDSALWNLAPAAILLLSGSALACLVPAARAAHVDPMQTLRSD